MTLDLQKMKEVLSKDFEGKAQIQKSLTVLSAYADKDLKALSTEEVVAFLSQVERESAEVTKILNKAQAQKELLEKELTRKLADLKTEFGVESEEDLQKEIDALDVKLKQEFQALIEFKNTLTSNGN